MKLYEKLGFRKLKGDTRRGNRYRKPNWDVYSKSQPWWHFDIGIHSPHDDDIEDEEDKHLVFKLRILGWSIWHTFGKPLKRDWDVSFGWWDQGFKIYYGPRTKIGGTTHCDDTGYHSFISFPWSKRRRWERIRNHQGRIVFHWGDTNWYAWKIKRLYQWLFRIEPKKFSFDKFREKDKIREQVSRVFDYTYTLNNGTIQKRKVTCYFSESFYGWIALPFVGRTHRYLNYEFSEEVGEESGSWKGGVIASAIAVTKKDNWETSLEKLKQKKFR